MFDWPFNLGQTLTDSSPELLQQKLFIQLIIGVGVSWLAGLLLLPFVLNLLWRVIARHFLSGLLQQNLIVQSLPWRSWIKPVGFVMFLYLLIPIAAMLIWTWIFITFPISSKLEFLMMLMFIPFVVIYCIVISPFLVQYVWGWTCQELLPAATGQGLVSPRISWGMAFIFLLLVFLAELVFNLPIIALRLFNIILERLT